MPDILVVGEDHALLKTRAAVLGLTGATVRSCPSPELPEKLAHPVDLVVLCHTLAGHKADDAAELIRRFMPRAHILFVNNYSGRTVYKSRNFDDTCSSEPGKLLVAARTLLKTPA